MFELYQLEQLLIVAEYGTLSGAAEQTHLSPSALSRSMQKLEREIGAALFIRHKNRIELNENGQLAVEYAKKMIEQANDMVSSIRSFDRKRHTIAVGSCAPAPLWTLLPALSEQYPEMTIASDMRGSDTLLQGLQDGTYQIIILPYQEKSESIESCKYGEEHLFFSLPPAHPLSGSSGLYFHDLNGETMLLRSKIGFWHQIHREKMPDTHFLVQEEISAFDELVKASALPCFTSDLVTHREGEVPNRIKVPILDDEANVTYYCLWKKESKKLLQPFLQKIS
ncbi:MAG: LysR family transcriptional regulator [Ruminococcus sp.]|jgi:DNA-binding transcriptional LysR family regulator